MKNASRSLSLLSLVGLASAALFAAAPKPAAEAAAPNADPLPPLRVSGQNYIDPQGDIVKFWGVNLTALYPDHATADATAANLAERQINLARPHHLLRHGKDWNPQMISGALVDYKNDSRTFDPVALDRFDYLNAALRRHGIYLAMSAHMTRAFRAGDAPILETTAEDAAAWGAAITEMNGWHWQKSFDPIKALPVIDERAALLTEEFLVNILKHKNPYTDLAYADDHQWISLEVVNESSLEYAIICNNRFPAYFEQKLQKQWRDYATAAGLENPGDIYQPKGDKAVRIRAAFFRDAESAYYDRIRAAMRSTGANFPMMFSNLWRGDNASALAWEKSDVIENHAYIDPLLVREQNDGIARAMRTALKDKPFFVGEFNQAEGGDNIKAQAPYRTQLMLGAPAYALLHDWSGIVWFSWNHGTAVIAPDGWSVAEKRDARLGTMVSDGMMLDHLRTAGLIYRRGLVAPSRSPMILWTDAPYHAGNYDALMRGKHNPIEGWQNIHGFRRAYGAEPAGQDDSDWLFEWPAKVAVSDTGEIVKDTVRKQLTVTAPQVEGFSGYLDGKAPAGLPRLAVAGDSGFATVIVVAEDAKPLPESRRLVLSRTGLDADLKETDGPALALRDLAAGQWTLRVTRPRSAAGTTETLKPDAQGRLVLPAGVWREAELHLAP